MSATDVRIQPIYGCKYREYVELVDANGAAIALNTGDTELSKDGAAFTDATNEMAEISTGFCSIDLTYAEMSYDCLVIVPKSTGALTRVIKLFPQRLPILRASTAQAGAAGSITLDASASAKDGSYVGCIVRASNNDPAGIQGEWRKIMGYTGSTKVATVAPNWENTPTSSTTFEILVPSDLSIVALSASSTEVVDEMETQMAADPTGFKVNVMEVNGTGQTANDNGADINAILLDTGTDGVVLKAAGLAADAVDEIWDEAMHGTKTARQLLGILLPAFAAGKATGGGTTTITIRDTEDGFNAITITVDSSGNRSASTVAFS